MSKEMTRQIVQLYGKDMDALTASLKTCIHCHQPTSGMCPRCRAYSCVRQACIEAHEMGCKG